MTIDGILAWLIFALAYLCPFVVASRWHWRREALRQAALAEAARRERDLARRHAETLRAETIAAMDRNEEIIAAAYTWCYGRTLPPEGDTREAVAGMVDRVRGRWFRDTFREGEQQ